MVVLYSPIGSPDLYSPKQYYTSNQGVTFNDKEIQNSPTFKTVNDNSSHEIIVPDYVPELKYNTSYPVKYSDDKSGNVHVGENNQPITFQKNGNSQNTGITGISGDFNTFIGSTSKQNSKGPNNGFYTLSTDLNLFGDNNRFSANNGITGTMTTDPGGDPFGPTIPIPDGWGFLLALAVGYALFKKYFGPQ